MATTRSRCTEILKQNLLVFLVLIGSMVGLGLGLGIRNAVPSESVLMWVGILGEVYMNMLKMMLVPLVVSTIITGKLTKHMNVHYSRSTSLETQDIFADLLRNIFPDNLISAAFQKRQTTYLTENRIVNQTLNGTVSEMMKSVVSGKELTYVPSSNILGLLVASTLFGIGTAALKDKGKPFLDFFSSTTEIVMLILGKLIWFTPIGVGSLIAKTVGSTKNLEQDFSRLGLYLVTVLIGCAIVMIILAPVFYAIVERKNPFRFFFTSINAYMITIATTTSALAIPEIIQRLEGGYKLDKRIVRFTVPLTTAIGRCGSVLYMSTSCLFVMQFTNQDIDAMSVTLVIILSTLFSLAIPSISGAGLITVIILLTALDIPPESTALLFTFEWILDRIRSCANVSTYLLCPVLVSRICKADLENKYTDSDEIIIVQGNADEKDFEKRLLQEYSV